MHVLLLIVADIVSINFQARQFETSTSITPFRPTWSAAVQRRAVKIASSHAFTLLMFLVSSFMTAHQSFISRGLNCLGALCGVTPFGIRTSSRTALRCIELRGDGICQLIEIFYLESATCFILILAREQIVIQIMKPTRPLEPSGPSESGMKRTYGIAV